MLEKLLKGHSAHIMILNNDTHFSVSVKHKRLNSKSSTDIIIHITKKWHYKCSLSAGLTKQRRDQKRILFHSEHLYDSYYQRNCWHCAHNQTWSKTTQKIITPSWCQSCILPTFWLQDCTLLCVWAHYYFSYLYGHNVSQDNLSLKYDKRTMRRSVENRDGVNGTEIFSSSSNLRISWIWYTGTQTGLW